MSKFTPVSPPNQLTYFSFSGHILYLLSPLPSNFSLHLRQHTPVFVTHRGHIQCADHVPSQLFMSLSPTHAKTFSCRVFLPLVEYLAAYRHQPSFHSTHLRSYKQVSLVSLNSRFIEALPEVQPNSSLDLRSYTPTSVSALSCTSSTKGTRSHLTLLCIIFRTSPNSFLHLLPYICSKKIPFLMHPGSHDEMPIGTDTHASFSYSADLDDPG